jgi:hypothetical protein
MSDEPPNPQSTIEVGDHFFKINSRKGENCARFLLRVQYISRVAALLRSCVPLSEASETKIASLQGTYRVSSILLHDHREIPESMQDPVRWFFAESSADEAVSNRSMVSSRKER